METTLGKFLDVFGPLLVREDGTTAAEVNRWLRARSSDKWTLLLDDAAQSVAIDARSERTLEVA